MNLDRFDELLDAYLLGELSEEQSAQFQEALETDSGARRRFVQCILIDARLHRLARSEPSFVTPRAPPPEAGPHRHMTPRRLAWAAAILVASATIALIFFARQNSNTLARVTSGTVLVDGQPRDRIAEGSALSVPGPASAVIDLPDGSRATLDPATQLTLRGRVDGTRQVLHLTAGGGQFQVPHGGGQFRIDTPAGSVTVLGTEFTVALRSPRSLFVSVAAGSVRFDSAGNVITLSAGQSRTFGPEPDRPPTPTPTPTPTQMAPDAQIDEGWIQSVDARSESFVLGGRNEKQTMFRVGSKPGEREADILLDGRKAAFQAAVQPGRKASVIYIKIGADLVVSKMEVTSATKEPDRPRPADDK